jgi:hypothetical protein
LKAQGKKDQTIKELLSLGILEHEDEQLIVSSNFHLVSEAENSTLMTDLRQSILHSIYRFVPTIGKQQALIYVTVIERYLLQN